MYFLSLQEEYKKYIYNQQKTPFKSFAYLCVLTDNYDIKGKSKYVYMFIHRVVQIDELTITVILFSNDKI